MWMDLDSLQECSCIARGDEWAEICNFARLLIIMSMHWNRQQQKNPAQGKQLHIIHLIDGQPLVFAFFQVDNELDVNYDRVRNVL